MIPWTSRAPEERALFNPCFFSLLLWQAAGGHMKEAGAGLPFTTTFLVLPLVLHKETRDLLPRKVTTSLPVWLDESPMIRARFVERAGMLAPYTKEALIFGGERKLLMIDSDSITGERGWKRKIDAELERSSDEVRSCAKKAEFLGRWYARSGRPETLMALLGVRP